MTGAAEETQRTQVRARPEVRKKDGGRLAGDGGVERGPGSLRARAVLVLSGARLPGSWKQIIHLKFL